MAAAAPASAPSVVSVHADPVHSMSKPAAIWISLRAGFGVEGDAHAGATVQHRSRVARDPSQPNLRQVHLIAVELLDELRARGWSLAAGEMGENVTTAGVDLLALPAGALLRLGANAVVEVTGLRNPCGQLDRLRAGLKAAVLARDEAGRLMRRAGVMAVVLANGRVRAGDPIVVELPTPPHQPLQPV